ncbi:transporter [Hafnia alvei]|uniref:amino acid permease n=1 Tax=Hafnia alvei TaxID=569 RepID=UPI00061D1C75|nr:amino acid permease [Hafnia alvei]KID06433.2 transporter [Hafnia alvei]MBW3474775.1 amino acid permease [Hafnia alvei]MDU3157177.1 amino acid permease [Hafnia alvei]TBL44416.1 transporter [Hafnia alvei]TBM20246.1 transporter [Hafnia alvei]
MSTIASLSETKRQYKSVPLTAYDIGWILLCIGMAIGAGTVLVPVQIGLKGIWVFIVAFLIAYPATYMLQNLYMKTLSESDICEDYSNIITQYLGKNWGIALGIIYFIMLVHGMFIYSISVIYDSASYLKTFGVTDQILSNSAVYKLIVFMVLVFIASRGERLLFKISGPMVVIKVGIIILLGLVMIPHWDLNNITAFPKMGVFCRDVLLTAPFAFFSAVFVQILNPMNIAYRKREEDKQLATYKAIRVHRISYIILISIIIFFSFSFTFSMSHEQAVEAFNLNISALAMAAKVIPGTLVHVMTTLLNIFAVLTAFLGIYLGFQEAVKGILVNIIQRFIPEDRINHKALGLGVYIFIVLLLFAWVSLGFSVVIFFHIGSPLYGIVSCLIPCYLVYKVKKLHKFKGVQTWCVLAFGILLVISPFLKFFE